MVSFSRSSLTQAKNEPAPMLIAPMIRFTDVSEKEYTLLPQIAHHTTSASRKVSTIGAKNKRGLIEFSIVPKYLSNHKADISIEGTTSTKHHNFAEYGELCDGKSATSGDHYLNFPIFRFTNQFLCARPKLLSAVAGSIVWTPDDGLLGNTAC